MRPHGSFSCWLYGQTGGNPAIGCRCPLCIACNERHRSPLGPLQYGVQVWGWGGYYAKRPEIVDYVEVR